MGMQVVNTRERAMRFKKDLLETRNWYANSLLGLYEAGIAGFGPLDRIKEPARLMEYASYADRIAGFHERMGSASEAKELRSAAASALVEASLGIDKELFGLAGEVNSAMQAIVKLEAASMKRAGQAGDLAERAAKASDAQEKEVLVNELEVLRERQEETAGRLEKARKSLLATGDGGVTKVQRTKELSRTSATLKSRAVELMIKADDEEGAFGLARETIDAFTSAGIVAFGEGLTKVIAEYIRSPMGKGAYLSDTDNARASMKRELVLQECLHAVNNLDRNVLANDHGAVGPSMQAATIAVGLTVLAAGFAADNGNFEKAHYILRSAAERYMAVKGMEGAVSELLATGLQLSEAQEEVLLRDVRRVDGDGQQPGHPGQYL